MADFSQKYLFKKHGIKTDSNRSKQGAPFCLV